jgi:hypothetical protein
MRRKITLKGFILISAMMVKILMISNLIEINILALLATREVP